MAKMGRPKKTLDDLPKDWEARVVKIGSEGGSDVEIRDYLNISEDLWYRFMDEEPHFSQTIKKARSKCQVWWEKAGRAGVFMGGKENPFNSTVWIFNMKNRFSRDWKDRVETNTTHSLDEALKNIADKLPD